MKKLTTSFLLLLPFSACMKYKVANPSLSTPHTVQELRALMDNNIMTDNATPGLGALGVDDCLLSYSTWQVSEAIAKNAYIWEKDIFGSEKVPSWSAPYAVIYQC